ncbi:DUF3793 family protein [Oscillospiraceae bacterium PP1C4]
MSNRFEQALAFHCAPALAGIKAANLISCATSKYPDLLESIAEYNRNLNSSGIFFEVLCHCSRHILLLVYRPKLLAPQLENAATQSLLSRAGYPQGGGWLAMLEHLKVRLADSKDFPHEIGLFLGYPLEDVLGFWKHKGKNYKLSGYWKVYSEPESAQQLFTRYDRCRDALCKRVSQGLSISRLFCAA